MVDKIYGDSLKDDVLKNAEIWKRFAEIRSKTRAKFFQCIEIKAPKRALVEFDYIKVTFTQGSESQRNSETRVLFENNIDDETAQTFNNYFTTERQLKIQNYTLANKKFYKNLYYQIYQRIAQDEYIDGFMNDRINMLYLLLQNYWSNIDASLFLQWLQHRWNKESQPLFSSEGIFQELTKFPTVINDLKEVIRVNIETENVLYSLVDKLSKPAQLFLSSNERYDPEFIPKVISLDFV